MDTMFYENEEFDILKAKDLLNCTLVIKFYARLLYNK